SKNVWYPFFVIEFKAAAGTNGNLWVAENQCAGGSAACVQAVNHLNTRFGDVGCIARIPNLCYSLAIDNNLAHLFVSWWGVIEEEEDKDKKGSPAFHIQLVDSFYLFCPAHLVRLHQRATAIIDWGNEQRLRHIQFAVDYILQAE
ncbi:hypothetical protein B0T24DRAFT_540076, partial [Lasiosphaeria ovina]